jgi:hypothetical protein
MAPEQLIRGGIVDHRTDLYAAGVVLYELLTGQRLYEAGPEPDYRALAKKVAKGEHDLPSKVDKALAPYDDLVATALRPKAEDRYQTAAEFRDAIQQALVGVNPTISTDQLGAFMRELFSEEMTAQRELHDRVAKAHLEDFQDQLTSSHTSTVSFAMALPLPPPDVPKTPPKRTSTRMRPPTQPTDILPQQPPLPPPVPTAAILTTDLDLADGTGSVMPTVLDAEPVRVRKKPVGFLLAAGILVAGGLVFAFTRNGGEDAAPKVAAKPTAPVQTIKVEEIPPEEQSPPSHEQKQVQPPAQPPQQPPVETVEKIATPPAPPVEKVQPTRVASHSPSKRSHEPTRTASKGSAASQPPKTEALTREAVIAKYRAVRQQYDVFKQQNGGRLDADWNDLAGFIQYHPNDFEEFSRRIDAFRSRMK